MNSVCFSLSFETKNALLVLVLVGWSFKTECLEIINISFGFDFLFLYPSVVTLLFSFC